MFGRQSNAQTVEIGRRVTPQDVILGGEGRRDAGQVQRLQRVQHMLQPRDAFGMARGGHMGQAIGMGQQSGGHARTLALHRRAGNRVGKRQFSGASNSGAVTSWRTPWLWSSLKTFPASPHAINDEKLTF